MMFCWACLLPGQHGPGTLPSQGDGCGCPSGQKGTLFPFLLLIILLPIPTARAQESTGEEYVYPADPLVVRKLEEWQDRKFGLLMHWGLYAQLGIVESWALCSEDQPFQDRGGVPYTEFKEMYFGQVTEFNPRNG